MTRSTRSGAPSSTPSALPNSTPSSSIRNNPEATRTFIDHAFRNGAVPTAGTKILPPESRSSAAGGHGEQKHRVLTRLGVFFE
jgi:type I restriction enzyme R subunit